MTLIRPGFDVQVHRPDPPVDTLRTDIAGFGGVLPRGPIGVPVRVADYDEVVAIFGADVSTTMGRSLYGYFANGGERAVVVRMGDTTEPRSVALTADERPTELIVAEPYSGVASSGINVDVILSMPHGRLTAEVVVWRPQSTDLAASSRVSTVLRDFDRVTLALPLGLSLSADRDFVAVARDLGAETGHVQLAAEFPPLAERDPDLALYRTGLATLIDAPDVSLVVFPDAWENLPYPDVVALYSAALLASDEAADRLVLVDCPAGDGATAAAGVDDIRRLTERNDVRACRAGAAYGPWFCVERRPGGNGGRSPSDHRGMVPSGHVAGVFSRLDRTQGIGRSPANADLEDLSDLAGADEPGLSETLRAARINPIMCVPGLGIEIWGAQTLATQPHDVIAHRRLLHRLVRAMRQAAESLQFENNTPELHRALRRTIGTVLLGAFRSGALRGRTPGEAFYVRCDDTTTSQDDVDNGRVVCELGFAPSHPMEFIHVTVTATPDGRLEVAEQ